MLDRATVPTEGVDRTPAVVSGPRSSNLRLAKAFTQRDKDRFKTETFEYIAKHFENSLNELQARNPGYEGTFRRVDANRFSPLSMKTDMTLPERPSTWAGCLGHPLHAR